MAFIEEIVLNRMMSKLSVPCYMEEPAQNTADSFVLIERSGGSLVNTARRCSITVQSYARSKYEACALNEEAKEAMFSLMELNSIGGVVLNSDSDFTDTRTKRYRYQTLFELTYID